jgi:hypothetical protein
VAAVASVGSLKLAELIVYADQGIEEKTVAKAVVAVA